MAIVLLSILFAPLFAVDRHVSGAPSDCCTPHATPACDDPDCVAEVCGADPFCCDELWDGSCVDEAESNCTVCGALSTCCEIHDSGGCDVPSCEALVCAEYPQCCDVAWGIEGPVVSALCVDTAIQLCNGLCTAVADDCGMGDVSSCCVSDDTPHCEDADCCSAICLGEPPLLAPDAYCCLVEWDALCVQAATNNPNCPACTGAAQDCCQTNFDFPGCNSQTCMDCVCPLDSFCCQFGWSPFCVDIAESVQCFEECGCEVDVPPCPVSLNNCCFAGFDFPGCSDMTCCSAVCAQDPFCCQTAWDFTCADAAAVLCPDCEITPCTAEWVGVLPTLDVVDARRPFPPGGGPVMGLGSADEPLQVLLAEPGMPASCFELCETASDGVANTILAVEDAGDGTYTLTLERPLTVNAVTTLSYDGDIISTYIVHPGNVDGNSQTGPLDILALIDVLNGIAAPLYELYSADVDRSGQIGPGDILAVIDLLNGAGALPMQNGTALPTAAPCGP